MHLRLFEVNRPRLIHFCLMGVVLGVIVSVDRIGAQDQADASGGRELTIEEIFLRQQVEVRVLREQAFTDDREIKFRSLDIIASRISEQGPFIEGQALYDQYEFILEYLALEGITLRRVEGIQSPTDFPLVRQRAVRLLGDLGGSRAKDALVTVLFNEDESTVRSEAVPSLGRIGMNQNNEVLETLAIIVHRIDPERADEMLAFSAIKAIEDITLNRREIADSVGRDETEAAIQTAIQVLLEIAQGRYRQEIKDEALRVLTKLLDY